MSKFRKLHNSHNSSQFRDKLRVRTEATEPKSKRHNKKYKVSFKHLFSTSEAVERTDESQQKIKDKLFHKNYSQFKEVFQSNHNNGSLPFILTLRQSKKRELSEVQRQATNVEAFEVAQKSTINQKIRKNIGNIEGDPIRVFQASYRWRKHSGTDARVSCEFETTLRSSCQKKKQEQRNFTNMIKPRRYKDIEQKRYRLKELICQHQKRVFKLQ